MAPGESPTKWDAKKKVLVIGAGASGLTSIKCCKEEGDKLEVVCYEKTGEFGGIWKYRDSGEDTASVMKSTVSNTSKEMSSFSDFPAPAHFPVYLYHTQVIKYLELYAEHFDLFRHITYNQKVSEVTPTDDYDTTGKWQVKVEDLKTNENRIEIYDGVMLCVGHHTFPLFPSYPNQDLYKGKVIHSHGYKTYTGMENKNILVVGAANSGTDIACELSNVAKKVYLSSRRGTWFTPRLFDKGKPADLFLSRRSNTVQPVKCFRKKLEKVLNARLDHERFGIKPHHSPLSQHFTINDEIHAKLAGGRVSMKTNIKEFTENGVIFEGEEQTTPLDVVVFATGYKFKFPFLKDDVIRIGKDNKVELYKFMFPPHLRHHTLAAIGLIQPSGSLFPVFEMQARWYVTLMIGSCHLPEPEEMNQDIKSAAGFRARAYVQSARHSVESPWLQYMDEIAEKINSKPKMYRFLSDPKLYWACFFGPCLPYQYRLSGPHKWRGARDAIISYKSRMYEHYVDKEDSENTRNGIQD